MSIDEIVGARTPETLPHPPTDLMRILRDITFADAEACDAKRENANIDAHSSMGSMLRLGSESAKQLNLAEVLDPVHAAAHRSGDIHIHDLDFLTLTTTCCQISLERLFAGGFSTGHGVLREPQSIGSYAALACIAIQSNQNDQHGGQSIPAFDRDMAPGVAKTFRARARNAVQSAWRLLVGEAGADAAGTLADEWRLNPDDQTLRVEVDRLAMLFGLDASAGARLHRQLRTQAEEETQHLTYQAMEAFIPTSTR